ncbi:MAG: prolipoprotein diacylglyceryl transferase [Erysipelotrichaceae bacterium]|jgi:phosphatidylglycerol:prolipoprotein diacylglycerol transferase|nr:prolipoprotein diacylglyceryl transferase [Erysipelotrichaceae bacterium]
MVGILLTYGGLIIALIAFIFLVLRARKIATAVGLDIFDIKKERMFIICVSSIFVLMIMMMFIGIPFLAGYDLSALEWFYLIIGSTLTSASICVFYITFRIHYYQKDLTPKVDKLFYWSMLVSIVTTLIFGSILTEAFALHVSYPLSNGISWEDGFHLVNILNGHPNIAWYAIFIVSGAVFVYFLSDHKMYQKYGEHGLLESTFYVAFPAGIIGARIAYVIGNWDLEFADKDFWAVFEIWNGGLTILGGAIFGIVAGILWFKWRHKNISVMEVADIVVPTILIAQAIGRWGNFFNAEVHGGEVLMENWRFLPTFILEQSRFSSTGAVASIGHIFAPLFWVEGVANIAGFFILAYLFGRVLKRFTRPGDLIFGYVIFYGGIRVFMEPLRYANFNMGVDGMWSWVWSIIFIGAGLLGIVINHSIRNIIEFKKQGKIASSSRTNYILLAVATFTSIAFVVIGALLFALYPVPTTSLIELVPHNIGLIFLIVGLFAISTIAVPLINLIDIFKQKKQTHEV